MEQSLIIIFLNRLSGVFDVKHFEVSNIVEEATFGIHSLQGDHVLPQLVGYKANGEGWG